jgi:U4/U6 small nuclear ribonucleoprotein PRP4
MMEREIEEGLPQFALQQQQASLSDELITEERKKVFYTPGSKDLKEFRMWCLKYSLPRAKSRIASQKAWREREEEEEEELRKQREGEQGDALPSSSSASALSRASSEFVKQMSHLRLFHKDSSQVEDSVVSRPLSSISFSPDASLILTSSWSGKVKLWSSSSCREVKVMSGHKDRANAAIFHPESTAALSPDVANFVSCGADDLIHLWSLTSSTPLSSLAGHAARVNRLAFHPHHRHLASTSHDMTWRLWDLETSKMILEQEGHSRPTFGVSFHPDGSLVCTTGLDGYGRIWDLRSGKSILLLRGHVSGVVTCDFAPDGFTLASGGDDHSVRIWDLRRKRCVYLLASHTHLVSKVSYKRTCDFFTAPPSSSSSTPSLSSSPYSFILLSSSFDGTMKIWTQEGTLLHTLKGHEGQVSDVDMDKDWSMMVSCGYDKTWKMWRRGKPEEERENEKEEMKMEM